MKMDESTWKTVQQRLGYNDEEMKNFKFPHRQVFEV